MIDGIGEVFTPFAQLRGDIYGVGGVDNQALNGSPDFVSETPDNGAILRGNALGGIEYRYPWMASTGSVTHVFEPIGQIIVRPNSLGNQQDIPNEDALSLVFDDTLLFDIDKFSGYDRIETGTRANVGMRYTAQLPSGTYAPRRIRRELSAGRRERIRHGLLPVERPRHRSLRLCWRPLHSGPVQSRLLGAVTLRREYLGHPGEPISVPLRATGRRNSGSTMPTSPASPDWPQDDPREEIVTAGVLALTEDWSLLGNLRYDLETSQTITDGLACAIRTIASCST